MGGFSDGDLTSVERYDPALDAWEAVAPMAEARRYHAVAELDGKLYAVGGEDAGYHALSSVERYDPATNAWEAVVPMGIATRFCRSLDVVGLAESKQLAKEATPARKGKRTRNERYMYR